MTPSISVLKLQALADVSAVVDKALDIDAALTGVLSILADDLEARRGAVALTGPDGHLEVAATHGLSDVEHNLGVLHCAREYMNKIFRTMRPVHIPDVLSDSMFPEADAMREALGDAPIPYTGVPIILDGEAVGVLSVDRLFGQMFSVQEDIEFLNTLAGLVGRLIRLNDAVRERERKLRHENATLKYRISKASGGLSMVGRSAPMLELEQFIAQAAPTSATVLLQGEPGTGKTLTAQVIHEASERRDGPFVRLDCASGSEAQLERTIFGVERVADNGGDILPGMLEKADGGTLLLDDVADLSPKLQSRLLRVLQDREFQRIGGTHTIRTNTRVIAASSHNLKQRTERGLFRASLFYRLSVLATSLPPLRKRMDDMSALFNHFRRKLAEACNRDLYCTPEALDLLMRHDWPGNVRELENIVERLAIMAEGGRADERLMKLALSAEAASRTAPGNGDARRVVNTAPEGKPTLLEMERNEILLALSETGWIKRRAGRILGLTERQIGYRIRKFGLEAKVAAERKRIREGRLG